MVGEKDRRYRIYIDGEYSCNCNTEKGIRNMLLFADENMHYFKMTIIDTKNHMQTIYTKNFNKIK